MSHVSNYCGCHRSITQQSHCTGVNTNRIETRNTDRMLQSPRCLKAAECYWRLHQASEIGWVFIPQKLIVTPSTPNRKLMAQQTDFCSELPMTHTHLSYLQLKHINRSARKNWLWQLFHLVKNLDLKFLQLSAAFSFPLQTRKGRESRKLSFSINRKLAV